MSACVAVRDGREAALDKIATHQDDDAVRAELVGPLNDQAVAVMKGIEFTNDCCNFQVVAPSPVRRFRVSQGKSHGPSGLLPLSYGRLSRPFGP